MKLILILNFIFFNPFTKFIKLNFSIALLKTKIKFKNLFTYKPFIKAVFETQKSTLQTLTGPHPRKKYLITYMLNSNYY